MKQHTMPQPPPITDDMTSGSLGAGSHEFIDAGPVSDRRETLLLFESGKVLLLSADPGYNDDLAMSRNEARWEFVLYDATKTPAGAAIQTLEPGQWM